MAPRRVYDLMTTDVITLPKQATLHEAVEKLAAHNISSLVVTEKAMPVGIITERDIARIAATRSEAFSNGTSLPVADFMSENPVTICKNADIIATLEMMERNTIRRLVVTDKQGRLKGIITYSDVVKKLEEELFKVHTSIDSVTTKEILKVAPEVPLKTAIYKMSAEKKSCILVVAGASPVGILTERDIVKLLLKKISMEVPVSEVCTKNIVYVDQRTLLYDALRIMNERGIRHLAVVDDTLTLKGVVTQTDIINLLHSNITTGMKDQLQRFKESLDMLQTGFIEIELNHEGTILWLNKQGAKELGFDTVEHVMGKSFVRMLKGREQWVDFLSRIDGQTSAVTFSFYLNNKVIDGSFRPGGITVSGIFRDVTDRFIESESIRNERNRFENIVKTLSEGLMLFDRKGVLKEVNQAALEMLGMVEEELLGKPYHAQKFAIIDESGKLLGGNDLLVHQVLKTGKAVKNVIQGFKKAEGSVVWVKASVTPAFTPEGEIEEVVMVITDITELYSLEKRNQKILETAKEGYWEVTLEGRITRVNKSLSEFLGYRESELLGASVYDIVDEENRKIFEQALEKRKQGTSESYTITLKSKKGRDVYTMVSASPLSDASGRVTGAFAFITDLSDLKTTHRELERQHSTLAAINEAIVSYIRSDDIKAPIELILNAALKLTESEYGAVASFHDSGDEKGLRIISISGAEWKGDKNKDLYDRAMQQLTANGSINCPFMGNLFSRVITTKRPVISNSPDDAHRKGVPEGHMPLRTFMGVPFLWHDRVIGLIALGNKKGGYAEYELDLIETMARSVSLMLYRDDERKASMQKDYILTLIASISRDLTRALTEEEAYGIFQHYLLSLRRGNARINALSFVIIDSSKHYTQEVVRYSDEGLEDVHTFPGLDKCKAYIHSGTFLIRDLSKDYACPYHNRTTHAGSYCCTAITIGGSIAGVLYMYSKQAHFFTEAIKETIDNFIALLAPIVNNMRLLESNKKLALIDPLTGLYNRRYLEAFMDKQLAIAERNNQLLSIVMFDIDNFKTFNDTYGHDAGDMALRGISQTIARNIRTSDIGVRYGGEEFIIVLPNTDKMTALEVAERIRLTVETTPITISRDRRTGMTASFGVATYGVDAESLDGIIAKADAALYNAKKAGKNRTCLA
ncbi:MAG: diguanylate cyclase [Nitrospirota bacterium]